MHRLRSPETLLQNGVRSWMNFVFLIDSFKWAKRSDLIPALCPFK
jgi:hypothetical protein